MKTLSGKISFVAVAVVAIIAVLSLRTFGMPSRRRPPTGCPPEWEICVKIKPNTPDGFRELRKTQGDFDAALLNLCSHGGHDITFKANGGGSTYQYNPCPHHQSIKTDKVTKSELASSTEADASAANDPNAVHYLYANSDPDGVAAIAKVLDCFKQ